MFVLHVLLLTGGLAPDTIVVNLAEALRRAEASSPGLEAAASRVEVARHGVGEARARGNPQIVGAAENIGAFDAAAGQGIHGVDGQVVVSALLPLGGDRRAALAQARARQDGSAAVYDLVRAEVVADALDAIVTAERERQLLEHASEERAGIAAFADALLLGARAGRFPAGDAAWAQAALVQAVTEEARRRAALAVAEAGLALVLGFPPETQVRVPLEGVCTEPATAVSGDSAPTPRTRLAEARLREAEAAVALSRARAVPDLHPQVGIRRSGGTDGLYLGMAFDLPVSGAGARRTDAARAERDAMVAESEAIHRSLASERSATASQLQALVSAASLFTAEWSAALDLGVSAALASYELGEGSLGNLLQARRTRIEGLRDHTNWLAETRHVRIHAARLQGLHIDDGVLCPMYP